VSNLLGIRPKTFAVLIVILSIFMAGAGTVSADSGRYNVSKPAIVEITNPAVSCYRAQGATTDTAPGCHMINWTQQAIGAQIFMYDGVAGGRQITHPGEDRSPAAMYPGWIHKVHGNGNWPQWQASDSKTNNTIYGLFGYPPVGVNVSGNFDVKVGDGTGRPRSFYRDFEEMDCPTKLRKAYTAPSNGWLTQPWGNPRGPGNGCLKVDARYSFKLEGCGANTGQTSYGCHGIDDPNSGLTFTPRSDSPACSQCHFTLGNVTSTNSKHGTVAGAGGTIGCADCHDLAGTATADQLDSNFLPQIRQCYECHGATKVGPVVNTTGMHAGKDCRYCHGHAHNITRDYSWNRTCGNQDSVCHGPGAPAPRNIGGGASFAHGSSSTNVTCGSCHIPSSSTQGAHNITVPACSKCHNATGVGNAATGRSSRYGSTGDTRSNTVPNWDRSNNIYHNGGRGDVGGLNCTFCHIPGVQATASNLGKIHYINSTQDNGRNYVPDCQDARCHGNSTTAPTGKGTWIKYSHGEQALAGTGFELTCVDCHNNYTLFFWNNDTANNEYNYTRTVNTFIHTTGSTGNITPFNASRLNPGTNNGEVSYTVCLLCHNATQFQSAGDCANCHTGANGVLEIHDPTMGVTVTLDGVMAGGCNTCHSSRNDGMPDNTKSWADASFSGSPPLHNAVNYSNRMHGWHVDNASAGCTNCHPSTGSPSMNNGSVDVYPASGSTFRGVTVSFTYTLNNNTYTPADNSTCTNIACHYLNLASQNRNTTSVFEWKAGGEQAANCNSCHLYPPVSGKHQEHMSSLRTVNGVAPSCTWCHGPEALNDNHTGHRNGYADVILASGGSFDNTTLECTGSCHSGNDAMTKPRWNQTTSLGCKNCHNARSKAPTAGWNVASSFVDYDTFTYSPHADVKGDRSLAADTDCQVCHTDASYAIMTGASDYEATGNVNTRSCYDCHT